MGETETAAVSVVNGCPALGGFSKEKLVELLRQMLLYRRFEEEAEEAYAIGKRLQPDEYTGATFSISNLGMFGIHEFTAVINPPEAGILAVGGVAEVPVVEAGQVVVRYRMKITMSCDHRVIDGALGAAFLATLKGMLEEPTAILV